VDLKAEKRLNKEQFIHLMHIVQSFRKGKAPPFSIPNYIRETFKDVPMTSTRTLMTAGNSDQTEDSKLKSLETRKSELESSLKQERATEKELMDMIQQRTNEIQQLAKQSQQTEEAAIAQLDNEIRMLEKKNAILLQDIGQATMELQELKSM
jgi:hypothetical protein